jgi:hypothetical protein
MMNRGSLKFLVVAALCGASNGFAPQPQTKAVVPTQSVKTSTTSLNVWNPFVKQEAAVAEIVREDPVPGALDAKNALAAGVWVSLITWAFGFAPGVLNAPADNELINLLISEPYPRPEGLNELWFAIWNCFAFVPLFIGALEAPVSKGQRLPATPFLFGAGAFGFFSLGPYFMTRTVREDAPFKEDLGFFSKNLFENKIFAGILAALVASIPFSSGLFGSDLSTVVPGYVEMFQNSRFVAVASADIFIMSLVTSGLVAEDAKRRGLEDKAIPAAVATILLPVLGPALYLVARPSLEE